MLAIKISLLESFKELLNLEERRMIQLLFYIKRPYKRPSSAKLRKLSAVKMI